MIAFVKAEDVVESERNRTGYVLLDERHGCENGCRCGISFYHTDEYGPESVHEDQEGFYVLEGNGRALIGGEELIMEPGMAFMVPAGVTHAMKREQGSAYCKVLWFHGAV